jgi:hypothetical protein
MKSYMKKFVSSYNNKGFHFREAFVAFVLVSVARLEKSEMIEEILHQTRKRARSIVNLCEELAYRRAV